MRGLSAKELVDVWERGLDSAPVERGLLLLSYCLPETTWDRLAAVSLGRRDAILLELRSATLGPRLNAFAVCPGCAAQLEFELDARELGAAFSTREPDAPAETHIFHDAGFSVSFRLPDSTDLYAASACGNVEDARRAIFLRCVNSVEAGQRTIAQSEIPETVIQRFAAYVAEREPAAEISLALSCPACTSQWELALDIVSFFWREIQAGARRLLLEVDALARAYGWGEADILSMSAARRQLYLEMVG
jgi:hypothetical protein